MKSVQTVKIISCFWEYLLTGTQTNKIERGKRWKWPLHLPQSSSPKKRTYLYKSNHWRCSVKKSVLKIFARFTGKDLCWSFFLIKSQTHRSATLLKRDSQVFSCEICKIVRSTCFEEHLQTTASIHNNLSIIFCSLRLYIIQKLSL